MTTLEQGPAGIDVGPVTTWLEKHVGLTGPLTFERCMGGHSNLTYKISDATGRHVVLRRPPLGHLLPTAHDMSREWRIIYALQETPVPVPPALGWCDDPDVTGAPFYVMGFVDGHVLHDSATAERVYDETQRRRVGESFVDVLAALHDVDPDAVGLGELGRKEGYVARQLKRWYGQFEQSKTEELPLVDQIHDFLAARIPEQGPARIVHGDYRLGNCLSNAVDGILAVLDWEICTLGDPLADVGYVLATWAERVDGDVDVSAPSVLPGFPTRAQVLERYAERSGRDLSLIDFYVSFSHWKSACIVEGVYARYLAGALDPTGIDLPAYHRRVERAARLAADAAERLP
jgi:aminoglycoside phosphotransferase (APT) family kinase protein